MSAPIYEIDENPIPPNLTADYLQTNGAKSIRYALMKTSEPVNKGTVIILHGRNECIEKYFETMLDLSQRGFDTATFDWLGQGGSSRLLADPARGHINSFEQYIDQFELFFDQIALPDCRGPFYVLAHSTGSTVALLASPRMINRVKRMVLCAPLLGLTNQRLSQDNIYRLSTVLKLVGLSGMYMGGGPRPRETKPFVNNILTSDERRYKRNSKLYEIYPALALGSPTVGWVNASCRAAQTVQSAAFKATLQIPTLIIAAGADKVVSNRAIDRFINGLRSTALVTIDGARHEAIQEADQYREQVFAAFDAFIPGSS